MYLFLFTKYITVNYVIRTNWFLADDKIKHVEYIVVCFSTVTVHCENVPGHASAGIIDLRNCTLGIYLWFYPLVTLVSVGLIVLFMLFKYLLETIQMNSQSKSSATYLYRYWNSNYVFSLFFLLISNPINKLRLHQ